MLKESGVVAVTGVRRVALAVSGVILAILGIIATIVLLYAGASLITTFVLLHQTSSEMTNDVAIFGRAKMLLAQASAPIHDDLVKSANLINEIERSVKASGRTIKSSVADVTNNISPQDSDK